MAALGGKIALQTWSITGAMWQDVRVPLTRLLFDSNFVNICRRVQVRIAHVCAAMARTCMAGKLDGGNVTRAVYTCVTSAQMRGEV